MKVLYQYIFTDRVEKLMTDKKITRSDLAARCGVAPSTISKWLAKGPTKWHEPSMLALRAIALALNVSADHLLGLDEAWLACTRESMLTAAINMLDIWLSVHYVRFHEDIELWDNILTDMPKFEEANFKAKGRGCDVRRVFLLRPPAPHFGQMARTIMKRHEQGLKGEVRVVFEDDIKNDYDLLRNFIIVDKVVFRPPDNSGQYSVATWPPRVNTSQDMIDVYSARFMKLWPIGKRPSEVFPD